MKTLKAESIDCQIIQNGLKNYDLNTADVVPFHTDAIVFCYCCRLVSDIKKSFSHQILNPKGNSIAL